ncbi:MAG: thioesterase family protein [Verrucomicrobiota bacterium]
MIHTITKIRVRYAETDRMDVVHHSNHLVWFELARIEMLDTLGIPYKEMEAQDLMIPVLSASVEYLSPSFFDDRLEIHLFMKEKPRARFFFEYEVKSGEALIATAKTSHAFMNKAGRGLRPPKEFLELLDQYWGKGLLKPA